MRRKTALHIVLAGLFTSFLVTALVLRKSAFEADLRERDEELKRQQLTLEEMLRQRELQESRASDTRDHVRWDGSQGYSMYDGVANGWVRRPDEESAARRRHFAEAMERIMEDSPPEEVK